MSGSDGGRGVRGRLRELGSYLIALSEESAFLAEEESDGWLLSSEIKKDLDDSPRLLVFALREYEGRVRRKKFLNNEILGEPAWDILLDLFISRVRNVRISVTSACIASQVPPTTALRWLTVLEGHGLIIREDDLLDGRRTWVQLTELGFKQMSELIRERIYMSTNFKIQDGEICS